MHRADFSPSYENIDKKFRCPKCKEDTHHPSGQNGTYTDSHNNGAHPLISLADICLKTTHLLCILTVLPKNYQIKMIIFNLETNIKFKSDGKVP